MALEVPVTAEQRCCRTECLTYCIYNFHRLYFLRLGSTHSSEKKESGRRVSGGGERPPPPRRSPPPSLSPPPLATVTSGIYLLEGK